MVAVYYAGVGGKVNPQFAADKHAKKPSRPRLNIRPGFATLKHNKEQR
jgi:hypothetical protein